MLQGNGPPPETGRGDDRVRQAQRLLELVIFTNEATEGINLSPSERLPLGITTYVYKWSDYLEFCTKHGLQFNATGGLRGDLANPMPGLAEFDEHWFGDGAYEQLGLDIRQRIMLQRNIQNLNRRGQPPHHQAPTASCRCRQPTGCCAGATHCTRAYCGCCASCTPGQQCW